MKIVPGARLLPSLAVHLVCGTIVEERVELEEPLSRRPTYSTASSLNLSLVVSAITEPVAVHVTVIDAAAILPRHAMRRWGRGQRVISPVFFAQW